MDIGRREADGPPDLVSVRYFSGYGVLAAQHPACRGEIALSEGLPYKRAAHPLAPVHEALGADGLKAVLLTHFPEKGEVPGAPPAEAEVIAHDYAPYAELSDKDVPDEALRAH